VLGPVKFIAYTEDVSELIAQHGVSYHLFADDKQLYTAVSSGRPSTPDVLHQCSAGLVCVSSVAAERFKDGTDLVWHQDITASATPIVC